MNAPLVAALALTAAVSVRSGQQPAGSERLESLQGTMILMTSDREGIPLSIWAKGNNQRVEVVGREKKAISIQLGDTNYSYSEGSKSGTKQYLGRGLGAMGLVRQIEEVKARGSKFGSEEFEGVRYDKYEYDVNLPREMAIAYLSTSTSLPRLWVSVIKVGEADASTTRMLFQDMKANVEIPDDMFRLPPDVKFLEDAGTRAP